MTVQDNIELVRRFYAVGATDDDAGREQFAEHDVIWHVPGKNRVSGRYQGHEDVFSTITSLMKPLDVFRIEMTSVMGNDDRVLAIGNLFAARGPHRVECRGGHTFRFSPSGLIAEVWGFVEDQQGLDVLLSDD